MLNAIITRTKIRIADYRVKRYLRNMASTGHEAFQDFGMGLDAQLWANFNKERLIRTITEAERQTNIPLKGAFVPLDEIPPIDAERNYAENKINYLVENKALNPRTYLFV